MSLLRADLWKLNEEKTLTEQAGVKTLATRFVGEAWPSGHALHALIAGAVADVCAALQAGQTGQAQRLHEFLRLWYSERKSVTAVAACLHLSRTHVVKGIQRPASLLVAQRFLELAQRVEPEAHSEGVRHVMAEQRTPQTI